MDHTPLPWRAEWLDDENGWIMDGKGNYIAGIVTSDEEERCVLKDAYDNAAFIKNACNSHYDLLEVCELVTEASMHWTGKDEERSPVLRRLRTLAFLALRKEKGEDR